MLVLLVAGCGQNCSSEEECNAACMEQGYEAGVCLPAVEADPLKIYLGPCVIAGSIDCDDPGDCQCYCMKDKDKNPRGFK